MKWERKHFTTRTATGPVTRHGSVCGAFGIEQYSGRQWMVYHLPSGTSFLYSSWPTLLRAKDFVEYLLLLDDWADTTLHEHPKHFTESCHEVADLMHEPRRKTGLT